MRPTALALFGPAGSPRVIVVGAGFGGIATGVKLTQAGITVRAVRRMIRERVTAIDVKPRFEATWNRWLQSKMKGTSWAVTNNYFKSPSGKVVTQWPSGNLHYRALTKILGRVSETTRRRDL
jgi:flavin-dependent dehydrogenase